ncbi:hypothetical protein INT43_008984 [Umbelopsis isabellina]|uniref:Major facilitator superfamily (MFS) profile domain-containing protein n=1 Tax=Mortierella isabellina TaxID=91625 RepID=A0A8H7UDA4_MORIS|nr:hypothetical protein INT43_008984 [Umbelopsis isabellina]
MYHSNASEETLHEPHVIIDEKEEECPLVPPDGGWEAWRVTLGASLIMLIQMGFVSSYGTLEAYYVEVKLNDKTESEISWIGSVQVFFTYFLGLFCGKIFDSYGTRWTLLTGTILFPFSLLLLSFSTQYWQMMLTQGILLGIASGCLFHPSMIVVSHWFNSKRALATGITTAGTAIGTQLRYIIVVLTGFEWAMRVISFISLAVLLVCNLLVKPFYPPKKSPLLNGLFEGFKDFKLCLLIASSCLIYFGFFIPNFYLTVYAESIGMDENLSYYCLTFLNIGSLLGRISIPYAADKLGRFNLTAASALVTVVSIFGLWLGCPNTAGVLAFSVMYGIFGTPSMALVSACCAEISEKHQVGTRNGLLRFTMSFPILAGPPLAGELVRVTKVASGYQNLIILTGLSWLAGSVLLVYCRLMVSKSLKRRV